MAETLLNIPTDAEVAPIPRKKRGAKKARNPLTPREPSSNQANILAGKLSSPLQASGKENQEPVHFLSAKKAVSLERELEDVRVRLEKMRVEKERTEELLRERDEMLRIKEEELERKGKEQERLQGELRRVKKMKEFKPTVNMPVLKSLREKEEEKKGKKKNKKNEGDAEKKKKRPCAPYILWCKDNWNEVKKENPKAEFKDIPNILSEKWKTLSEEEKKPYEQKYQEDKEAYLQVVGKEKRQNEAMKLLEEEQKQKTAMELLEQYLHFKQEADEATANNATKKKTKKEKDPSKPKRSLSAFFVYMKERRAALVEENKSVSEIAKITGEEWKNMSEEARRPYEEVAKKQKEDYLREMDVYKQNKETEAATREQEEDELMKIQKQEALQLLKKKEKTDNIIKKTKEKRQQKKKEKSGKTSDTNKPKRPPSSFLLFSMEMRKKLVAEKPDINNSTLTALISVKWKELNEAEKDLWNTKAANAMNAYKREMQEYNSECASAAAAMENNQTPSTE